MKTETKYGLVLSGGGIKGIAHIGVLKALEEHEIYPSMISGSSIGAIVGAFYAADYSTDQILEFFRTTSLFSAKNYSFRKAGFVNTNKFYNVFKDYFPQDSFEALQKKLFVSTTNLVSGESEIYHKGPLIQTLLASSALPGLFSPMKIENKLFADGGIANNFPIEPLIENCDKIIGVYVQPLKNLKLENLKNPLTVMQRAYYISRASNSIRKFSNCDLIIKPQSLNRFGLLSMNHETEIFQIGYKAAIKELIPFLEHTEAI